MANIFEIKYLFELYPDTDFTEEFVVCQTIEEKNNKPENQMTEDKWGDIRDSTNRNRIIQTTIIREYEVKIIVSRNINVPILEYSPYISLTTTEGETFLIYDVSASYSKVSGSLNYIVELNFKRADNNVVNHLSSDNVYDYLVATSDAVNTIRSTSTSVPISFTIDSIYSAGSPPNEYYTFTITSDNMYYDLIDTYYAVNDYFYINIQGIDLETDNIYECYVYSKADPIAFRTNLTTETLSDKLGLQTINLSFSADWYISSNVVDIDVLFTIYTFIEPFFDHSTTLIDGINAPDGIEENQKTIEKDIARFKIWLKQSELWKIEYLNYALFNDILVSLANYSNLVPSQVKGISNRKDNKALIDLYEYDIEILYNNKTVNIYR